MRRKKVDVRRGLEVWSCEFCCSPQHQVKPELCLFHWLTFHSFSTQITFVSILITEPLTSVIRHIYYSSWHSRTHWPRNPAPVCETGHFDFKMWSKWKMLVLTRIHSRRPEIKCYEIYLMMPPVYFYHTLIFSLNKKVSSTKCILGTSTDLIILCFNCRYHRRLKEQC